MAHTIAMLKSRLLVALSLALTSAITFSGLTTEYAYAAAVSPASVSIAGSTPVGSTLTATIDGAWDPADATVSYQWKRGSSPISGETLSTYVTVTADIGQSISVDVTATAVDYEPVTISSNAITPNGVLASTGVPVISKVVSGAGSFIVGRLVAASTNVFNPSATSFSYEWRRNSVAITDATGAQYQLSDDDAGQEITVKVTGHLANYTDEYAISDPITPVGVFSVTPRPTISGTTAVGGVLTADPGTWTSTPTDFEYQWFRDAVAIDTQIASTYTVAPADVGTQLSVRVTATRTGFTDASQTSVATSSIINGDFSSVGTVSILRDGTAVGDTFTADPSGWVPSQDSFSYQWRRDGVNIDGETGATYDLVGVDRGYAISVRATAVRSGYNSSSTVSSSVSIPRGSFVVDVAPAITDPNSGTQFAVGHTLTSSTGTFSPTPASVSYQWNRNGNPITSGGTARTYTLVTADAGASITVTVTAAHPNFVDEDSESSAITGVGQFTATTAPTISGTREVDHTLTANVSGWTPAPTSWAYAWYRDDGFIEGATEQTLDLTSDDLNHTFKVRVTGSLDDYESVWRESTFTGLIGTTWFTATGTVVIEDSAMSLGDELTATNASWVPDPDSYTYQWLRNGSSISGATEATYTIVDADLAKSISVRVKPVRAGYVSSSNGVLSQTISIPLASFDITGLPTISGTTSVPNQLSLSTAGVFSPAATSTQIQWLRNSTEITGATASTYDLVAADSGKSISVRVTVNRTGYEPSTVTTDVSEVSVASRFTASPNPSITGTPQVDKTLTANTSGWLPEPTSFTYQWLRNGVAISGEVSETYDVVPADIGALISVAITPFLDNYIPTVRTSRATAAVYAATFGATRPVPTISGLKKVGAALTAELSGWTPSPTSVSYQWLRNGVAIVDATSALYTLTSNDLGSAISVRATPVKAGYAAAPVTSLDTAPIALGVFSNTPTPTISGTVAQGSTLTAAIAAWTPTATVSYVWKRAGVAISGATNGTYVVAAADAGSVLSVTATGARTGYAPVSVSSTNTIAVPSLSFADTENPTITGDAAVGSALSVDYGDPDPLPETVTYQWLLDDEEIPDATGETYIPVADDLYQDITVTVSYDRAGYEHWSETSEVSVSVAQGTIGSLTAPIITGTARLGRTLTATFGTWDAAVESFTYQWFRDGDPLGEPVTVAAASAASVTYVLTSEDVGGVITFDVLAMKDGYADEQVSSNSTAEIGLASFNLRPVPTIAGVTKVGNTLTATTGSWSPNPSSFTFQWTRDGVDIESATSETYVLGPLDAGRVIRVVVTGVRSDYESQSSTSLPTGSIANGTFTSTPLPTISGTARVGVTVSAVTGTWSPVATSSTFVWKRNGVTIAGATSPTYEIVAADLNTQLTVVQTGSSTGYAATPVTSLPTVAVVTGIFGTQPTPQVSGLARIGSMLTASSEAWQPAASTLTYQWKRAGVNITGATGSTYVVQPIDAGSTISVAATASRLAYLPVTKVSAATATIDHLVFSDAVTPTISGLEKVEGVLTASTGDWTPIPTQFTYQWNRRVASVTTPIAGATSATYTLVGADAGATISVSVTATKLGYTPLTYTSERTEAIENGTLSLTPVPVLTGVPQVGVVYTAAPGTWAATPVQLSYQWLLDEEEIDGATSATYTPVAADVDGVLSVEVTGSKAGYDSVTQTSAATEPVLLGVFAAPTPTIAGTPKVGIAITATPGAWVPVTSPARTYQWKKTLAGVTTNISDATSVSYTPVAADVGATLTFTVSGGRDGYVTQTKNSIATIAVAKGTFSVQPTPVISGDTTPSRVGQRLTASVGRWTPNESGVTYQWKRAGVAIAGATGTTYDTVAADLNTAITVTATATLVGYVDGPATSAARTISAGVFTASATPLITGTKAVNGVLTAVPGEWSPVATFTYQWKRAGVNITGATASTYVLRPEDADKKLTVVVTGSRAGYTSIVKTSAETIDIARIPFTAHPEPIITGTVAVGQTLTVVPGAWTPSTTASPIVLTYRWERDGDPITGATSSTYVVLVSDEGTKLRAYVTGTKLGYITDEEPSAETSAVVKGTFTAAPKPTISGTAKVGVALTAVPGTWAPSTVAAPISFTYQWKREGTNISGATAATYTPVAADLGKPLSVSVTGAKTGYNTVTQTSDPIERLTTIAGRFATVPRPTIAGTSKVGVELTATPGTWLPGAGSLTYQWRRNKGATTINIAGATSSRYTPGADDQGWTLSVVTTATTAGYVTTSSPASISTAVVALGTIETPTTLPAISGTVKVGQTLTATTGATWPVGAILAYQWNRNGLAISTARASTYVLVTADLTARITVTVTANLPGYAAKGVTSLQTVAVTSP